MTLTEQVKILDDKIRANKAQYDLDRQAAKTSALSSGELEKYEYLTGKNLGHKPDVVQKAKFEYSPLGEVFNKGLDISDKKEGLLKRLKNVEGKNEQQLELIKNQGEKQLNLSNRESKKLEIQSALNPEANNLIDEIKKEIEENEGKNFLCTHSNGKEYNFYKFGNLDLFGNKSFSGQTSIEDALEEQSKMEKLMSLKKYKSSNDYKKNARKQVLKNAENLLETRNNIINAFRDGTFPLAKNVQKGQTKEAKIDWMHRPISELKDLKDKLDTYSKLSTAVSDKKIGVDSIKIFLNGILFGGINKDNVKK